QSLTRPHPPILIGGGGEKKTLRLVAQYANACNLFPTPEIPRKLEILREHCRAVGRNYDDIEKTSLFTFDLGDNGENLGKVIGGPSPASCAASCCSPIQAWARPGSRRSC